MTLSQAEFEAHIVGSSSNVNIEPEQIPSDNVEGLIPTVEIQSQQPMKFNFDELSGLEPDQIPQSVRQSQMSVPDESQLPPPQSQSRRKYHCPSCDKSYTQSHNLKKHRKKEHGLS